MNGDSGTSDPNQGSLSPTRCSSYFAAWAPKTQADTFTMWDVTDVTGEQWVKAKGAQALVTSTRSILWTQALEPHGGHGWGCHWYKLMYQPSDYMVGFPGNQLPS